MSSLKSPSSLASRSGAGSTHRAAGEIHVIVGPMFAGKTTALLRRIKVESNNGRYSGGYMYIRWKFYGEFLLNFARFRMGFMV